MGKAGCGPVFYLCINVGLRFPGRADAKEIFHYLHMKLSFPEKHPIWLYEKGIAFKWCDAGKG